MSGLAAAQRLMDEVAALDRPRVVFDADGTLWRGDVGEDFLRFAAASNLLPRPGAGVYHQYEALVAKDHATGYAFAVEVMAGLEETALEHAAADFFTRRFAGRLFGYVRPFLKRLADAHAEVWICSASPRWIVVPGAEFLGIPKERVIGVECALTDGRLALPVTPPVPCGPGKVTWLKRKGLEPALAVGNGDTDLDMLAFAQRALAIATPDGPDNHLISEATKRGWPVLRA